ncbi:hypothetical protein ACFQZ4_10460 [Catellatospora coxensis]
MVQPESLVRRRMAGGARPAPAVAALPRTYAVMAWLFAVAIAFFLGYKIIEYYNLIMAGKV